MPFKLILLASEQYFELIFSVHVDYFLGVLFSDLVQFCCQTAGERARRIAAGETNRFFQQLLEAALHKQRPNLEEKLFYSNPTR